MIRKRLFISNRRSPIGPLLPDQLASSAGRRGRRTRRRRRRSRGRAPAAGRRGSRGIGAGASRVRGPITRWTSRAWTSNAMRPPASFRATVSAPAVQSPGETPVVAPQRSAGASYTRGSSGHQAARRREVHRLARYPRYGLGETAGCSSRRAPPGSARVHGDVVLDPLVVEPGFGEEPLDDALRPLVVALAEPMMPESVRRHR